MNDRPVIAVLVSGSGSNLQAIIDASERGEIPGRVGLVLSNKADAYGLERARKHGIPTAVVEHKAFGSREAFRTFNMGIGMVLMVRPGNADLAVAHFRRAGVPAAVIGEIRKGRRRQPDVTFAGGGR